MTFCDRTSRSNHLAVLQANDRLSSEDVSGRQRLQEWIGSPIQSHQILLELMVDLSLETVLALSMEELYHLATAIERQIPVIGDKITQEQYQQWLTRTVAEIQHRQARYQQVQSTLLQHLQEIRELNPDSFDREFGDLDLEPLLQKVLDGKEAQQEISACVSAMNCFYEHYKLIRLARIQCRVREASWQLRRITLACRLFTAIGLAVVAGLLSLSLDVWQTLVMTLLVAAPMMLWITHPTKRGMKEQAKRELEQRKGLLYGEWQRLDEQETRLLDRWTWLVQSV